MRCRRGASRGRSIRSRPSTSSEAETSSEHVEWRHSPVSQNKRGSARPPNSTHATQSSLFPSAGPTNPVHPGPRAPDKPFFRQTSQRSELHFDCSYNRPSITVFVTVSLREEISCSPAPLPNPIPPPTGLSHALDEYTSTQPFGIPGPTSPDLGIHPLQVAIDSKSKEAEQKAEAGNPSLQVTIDSKRKEEGQGGDVVEPDNEYACRIVEELPSPHT